MFDGHIMKDVLVLGLVLVFGVHHELDIGFKNKCPNFFLLQLTLSLLHEQSQELNTLKVSCNPNEFSND